MPSSVNKQLRDKRQAAQNVTVWLGKQETETTFWCPFCRKGLIQHKQRIISIINGDPEPVQFLSPPISVQCESCGARFHFQGFNG